jgi:N-acetylglucosaminyl-diphospho-decaprenol L-rhamnosyltransferase
VTVDLRVGATPEVRIVVVTFSPGASLAAFLGSLADATTASYEVVLSDNGSTDGSVEAAETDGVTLLRTGGNVGYGRAVNLGAAAGEAGWLLIANPDVVLHPGSLDELIRAGERWPEAGAFGPAIRTPEGGLYPSARNLPSLGRGIGHALLGWWWPSNPWTKGYRNESGDPVEGVVGWLSGSCLLVRTSAFDAVGGFDPTYFMYFEDLDLCRRLGLSGTACVYVPSAVVEHSGGHATQRDRTVARQMLRAHHTSAYQYLSREYPRRAQAPLRWVLRAGLALRYVMGITTRTVGDGARPTRAADTLEP